MRWLAVTLALLTPAFAGCIADPAAEAAVEESIAPATNGSEDAPTADASPPVVLPEPEENTTVAPPPPPPLPCVALALADACIADGFHFGEAVFWDGGAVPSVAESGFSSGFPANCAATTGCRDLTFDVAETATGARLRLDAQVFFRDPSHVRTLADTCIGIELCGYETGLILELFPPGVDLVAENRAASGSTTGTFAESLFVGGYDEETREALPGPAVGTWTLRITGQLPDGVDHRLRAKLEAPTPPSDALAYPDLRIIPPFEVGFMAPTESFQPGVPLPTAAPVLGCMAGEYIEAERNGLERPTICLRFSMGFANAGEGVWRLKMLDDGAPPPATPLEDGSDIAVVQSVCTADARLCRDLNPVPGLVTRWDDSHGHYHYQNAYVFDLHRVVPAGEGVPPTLEAVSPSGKLGIDPGAETLVGWSTSFTQRRPWAPEGTGAVGAPDPADRELQAGWGDVYDWNRAGNYVPFPADAALRPVPGEYVLKGATDPLGQIAETADANNVGYTWFSVDVLGNVEILERGYGADPWAATKELIDVTP